MNSPILKSSDKTASGPRPFRRKFIRDNKHEQVAMTDERGQELFPLAELPGAVLSWLMVDGLAKLLSRHSDPRSYWLQLRKGDPGLRRDVRSRNPKPRKGRYVGAWKRAVAYVLLDKFPTLSTEEAVAEARAMDEKTLRKWTFEPEVILHFRRLTGKPLTQVGRLREKK